MILFALHLMLAVGPAPRCVAEPLSVVALQHVAAPDVAAAVQPLLDEPGGCGARIVAVPATNQLLMRVRDADRLRLVDLIRRLDRPAWQPPVDAPITVVVERQAADAAPGPGPGLGHTRRQSWSVRTRAGEEVRVPIVVGPDERLTIRVDPVPAPEAPWAPALRYARAIRSLARPGVRVDLSGWSCRLYWAFARGQAVAFGDGLCESLL